MSLLLSTFNIFAEVATCIVSPRTGARDLTLSCPRGKSETHINKTLLVRCPESYKLELRPNLYKSPRTVHILDHENKKEVLTIQVSDSGVITITTNSTDNKTTYIFSKFNNNLKELIINTNSNIIITNTLQIEHKLKIKAHDIYLLAPLFIKNGTFYLQSHKLFVNNINNPFQSLVKNNYTILKSQEISTNPSRRRLNLNSIPHQEYAISTSNILAAYKYIFNKDIAASYAKYREQESEEDKINYLKKYVFSKITDNKKKGALGEYLYLQHLAQNNPKYKFKDPKMGLNSFDAVHVEHDKSGVKNIIITEVKYAHHGKVILGVKKIHNQEWRQLSIPYVKSVLNDMHKYNQHTRALATLITSNTDAVLLKLAVFNPINFNLVVYDIGTMNYSLLD